MKSKGEAKARTSAARSAAMRLAGLALLAAALLAPAVAQAAPPTVEAPSLSAASETSLSFEAQLNPNNREVKDAHFEAISQADYEAAGGSFGAGTLSTAPQTFPSGNEPVSAEAGLAGLTAGTTYRLRLSVKSTGGETKGPEAIFHTLAPAPTFAPCPNEAFRSGVYAPLGNPSATLPDCRAYEQASPIDKNGGDATGAPALAKAASDGSGISFGSTFGIPGGQGNQELPTYLATRAPAGPWSTFGLAPPATLGEGSNSRVIGWLPDFSATFATAQRLTKPRYTYALFELHPDGAPPTQIAPYVPGLYSYAGASADGGEVLFQSEAALGPEEGAEPFPGAVEGAQNVYLWDAQSGKISLVSRLNEETESEAALPRGAFAGPYDWAKSNTLAGGSSRGYYTQEERVISADGKSVYFTAAGSGRLYRRTNPAMPQSALNGEGECTEPQKACTVEVSASEKENGEGPDGKDSAGPQPAALAYASEDGETAFFTSSEKLTDDANTGPEQPAAQIGRFLAGAEEPEEDEPSYLPAHALGVAVDPAGEHVYWADPVEGTIGRATLSEPGLPPSEIEPRFIEPGETEAHSNANFEPPATFQSPTVPKYVAVDSEYVYWTNRGPLDKFERPIEGDGTIGRAKLDPESGEVEEDGVEPEWIAGAFNPQGIAVNDEFVYWANAATGIEPNLSQIGRATIEGEGANQKFIATKNSRTPYGVALDATHVYFATKDDDNGFVEEAPLGGGTSDSMLVGRDGNVGVRGVAIEGGYLYWANQVGGTIGRVPVASYETTSCATIPNCEPEYLSPEGKLEGLAADPEGRIYYSVNGEAPKNPGNDLYRWTAASDSQGRHLTDLTADGADEAGAEVLGVLGASADGAYVYFLANADLDEAGPAQPGGCDRLGSREFTSLTGQCSLYLRHEDPDTHAATTSFLARLSLGDGTEKTDVRALAPTPRELFGNGYVQKTATLSADGRSLMLRSATPLTSYPSEGRQELYLHRAGEEGWLCLSCNPSGLAASKNTWQSSFVYGSGGSPREAGLTFVRGRYLSADGSRAFFESDEALVGADVDAAGGCPPVGSPIQANSYRACRDVYEWEAPGTGSCTAASTSYSPQNGGCIYLLSPGDEEEPSFLIDADETGENVFIFTRGRLVGQDEDSLIDVYGLRVGGGLASQSPEPATPCKGEACKGPASGPPAAPSPGSAGFQGPGDTEPRVKCPKGKRKVKRSGRVRCVKRVRRHRHGRAKR